MFKMFARASKRVIGQLRHQSESVPSHATHAVNGYLHQFTWQWRHDSDVMTSQVNSLFVEGINSYVKVIQILRDFPELW